MSTIDFQAVLAALIKLPESIDRLTDALDRTSVESTDSANAADAPAGEVKAKRHRRTKAEIEAARAAEAAGQPTSGEAPEPFPEPVVAPEPFPEPVATPAPAADFAALRQRFVNASKDAAYGVDKLKAFLAAQGVSGGLMSVAPEALPALADKLDADVAKVKAAAAPAPAADESLSFL